MEADQRLTQVLVEFAHTLGTDYALGSILDHLVLRAVELLDVTAAGVMLRDPVSDLHFVAASDETILGIERLQQELGEGPCLTAFLTGQAVSVPDLSVDTAFPRFSDRALSEGMAAVFTFPLSGPERRLGALDLYRDVPGPLSERDRRTAAVLADVAGAYVANAQARQAAALDLARAHHMSLHDSLTGLPNRSQLLELLGQALVASRRSQTRVTVLFVDLDRFKSVNDRFGHHVGDLLLAAVAKRLSSTLRPGDVVARLAGDEFVVLAPATGPEDAERLAERVTRSLTEPFHLAGRLLSMTASVGIAVSHPGDINAEQVIDDADHAMYLVKAAGGADHRRAERAARLAATQRAHLEAQLMPALRRDELSVAYQPVCRTSDGMLVAVEALLRWHHPTRGAVTPSELIPIAERTAAIVGVGQWVLDRACRDFVRWRSVHGDSLTGLSVNVSGRQIHSPDWARTVAEVLSATGMEPTALHLEVTESVLLDDARHAGDVLEEVKRLGVGLSLDDFGTGYSSLTYLRRLPFDQLKIDQTLVADLSEHDPASIAILRAVLDLGKALRLSVVCEGVETAGQLARVRDLGSELAQGFHLAPPMSAAELETRVLNGARDAPVRLPLVDVPSP